MLLDLWSCQGFNTAELGDWFSTFIGAGGSLANNGPRSNYCYNSTTGGNADTGYGQTVPASGAGFRQYLSFRFDRNGFAIASLNGGNKIVGCRSGATIRFTVSISSIGKLNINNSSGTTLATSTLTLADGVWHKVRVFSTLSASVGTVRVVVNDVDFINASGLNLGGTTWDNYLLPDAKSGFTFKGGDFAVADAVSGDGWDTFDKHIQVNLVTTTSEGDKTMSTPSTGSDREAMVDEVSTTGGTSPNGDTDYNTVTAVNDEDTFNAQAAPNAGYNIIGVSQAAYVKLGGVGTASIALGSRRAGTSYYGTGQSALSAYKYIRQMNGHDPSTSAAWTEANFNATQIGYKKTA